MGLACSNHRPCSLLRQPRFHCATVPASWRHQACQPHEACQPHRACQPPRQHRHQRRGLTGTQLPAGLSRFQPPRQQHHQRHRTQLLAMLSRSQPLRQQRHQRRGSQMLAMLSRFQPARQQRHHRHGTQLPAMLSRLPVPSVPPPSLPPPLQAQGPHHRIPQLSFKASYRPPTKQQQAPAQQRCKLLKP